MRQKEDDGGGPWRCVCREVAVGLSKVSVPMYIFSPSAKLEIKHVKS